MRHIDIAFVSSLVLDQRLFPVLFDELKLERRERSPPSHRARPRSNLATRNFTGPNDFADSRYPAFKSLRFI